MVSAGGYRWVGTVLGCLAVVIWGSLVAVVRGLSRDLGPLPTAACANLLGGAVGGLAILFARGRLGRPWRLSKRYLLGCGSLFVLYNLALYLAIDRAIGDAQAVEVALVNYLWPALTVVLSLPVLGNQSKWYLWPGLAVTVAGTALAVAGAQGLTWSGWLSRLGSNVVRNPSTYLLALTAAVAWALYSNLARRWAADRSDSAVPLFLLGTGVALALPALLCDQAATVTWTASLWLQLLYLGLFPTLLAYVFWDVAMRRGNAVLVTSVSFLTPLISTMLSCLLLAVPMGAALWLACGLIVGGAVVCRRSVVERSAETAA